MSENNNDNTLNRTGESTIELGFIKENTNEGF